MLASRLPGILPPMSEAEALEAAAVLSVSEQGFDVCRWACRPFRAPHHTASGVALVGGGSSPRPGEISLAHQGVLFLDELPEFDRRVLEVLREPLESGRIVISRAARQAEFPARFQLIAAMNPCPCGYLGDPVGRCRCSPDQVARYRGRISGPLLDRIDMHVDVPRLSPAELSGPAPGFVEKSAQVRERVTRARVRQNARCGRPNHTLDSAEVERVCPLDCDGRRLMEQAMQRLGLSARAFHRVLKLARTIADLAAEPEIRVPHLSEAISYRRLDRRQGGIEPKPAR
jgi:magnesium chelatase family protein